MSQQLILELSDEVYAAIKQQAETVGISPAQLAVTLLGQNLGIEVIQTEAEKQAARKRFESHFGEIDLGYPTGADNDSIDADLAREYASDWMED